MRGVVLILGASGKVGRHSHQAFAQAGWEVSNYDRRSGNLIRAAEGVDVIVNGLNPPGYHNWTEIIPAITREVVEAAQASGATVLVPGNVYNLDDQGGEWSEFTPHRPTTRKGRIREEMERTYEASGVQTIILRAGNFIVPERTGDVMDLLYLRALRNDKITLAGDAHVMQAYCYVPDWARAACLLAERRSTLNDFEDVPFPGHGFTAEDLRRFLSEELGRPLRFTTFPWWAMSIASPFWELAREMLEMRYLWNVSHRLAGTKLARLRPDFEPTPLAEVLRGAIPPELRQDRAGAGAPELDHHQTTS